MQKRDSFRNMKCIRTARECVCVCVCVCDCTHFNYYFNKIPPEGIPPYFDVVVGFVRSHDPESYAGGSVCYW